jgi:hypothetical protein
MVRVNDLTRAQVVRVLEEYGYACYDKEDADDLREALRQDIEDGIIDEAVVEAIVEGGA